MISIEQVVAQTSNASAATMKSEAADFSDENRISSVVHI